MNVEDIPFGLREFCEGLSDQDRLAVVFLLTGKILDNVQIGKELNFSDKRVEQCLSKLSDLGIIARVHSKWNGDKMVFESQYVVYPIYQKMLKDIVKLMRLGK